MRISKTHIIKVISLLFLMLYFFVTGCASPRTKQIQIEDAAAEAEARKQRVVAFEVWIEDWHRLNNVSHVILRGSAPLCEDSTSFSTGIVVANIYSFPEEMREAALTVLDVSDSLKVIQVMRDSAADRSGIRTGDTLTGINDHIVPSGANAVNEFTPLLRETRSEGSPVSLTISRNGDEEVIEVVPDRICDYNVLLSNDDIINALADGRNVIITRGLMRFTRNDIELALVVSHELAHNVMKHIDAKKKNYLLGTVLDITAAVYGIDTQGIFGQWAAQAYSKEFEAEADYVGLYMMAPAGLDIKEAPRFWRRMATIHPGNIRTNHAATHPPTPHRFLALEKTVEEINRKISEGLPLRPDMKDDGPYFDEEDDPYDY